MWVCSLRYWAGVAALAGVYFGAGHIGLKFDPVSGYATLVWPPTGIALAALLLFGYRFWPGIAAGAFLLNLSVGVNLSVAAPWLTAIGIATGNTLEALVGAYLVQYGGGFQPALERLRDVLRLILPAAMLSTLVSATIGVSSLWLGSALSDFGATWMAWWVGDLLGVLVFAPLVLVWATRPLQRITAVRFAEASLLGAALLAIGLSLFAGSSATVLLDEHLKYLIFPLLIWAALRFGPRGAATVTLVILVLSVWGAYLRLTPFDRETLSGNLLLLQLFVGAAAVTGLILAAVVAERSHAEHLARESETRLSTLAQAVPGILFTNRPDGSMDYMNEQFYEYTGMAPGSATGYGWAAALHPEDAEPTEAQWLACVKEGRRFEHGFRIRASNGTYRWFLARAVPLCNDQGRIVKWFGACIDIDGQKRAEEALLDADRRKDDFLAMLAHELRNPLSPIVNALHMVRLRGDQRETAVWANDVMERQVRHLVRLVDDLLEVSRISRGKMTLKKERIEISAIVNQAIDTIRPLAQERRHELTVTLPSEPVWLEADPTRLVQILTNLLNNAAKYTEPGGRIALAAERLGHEVVLRVSDNGAGIAPELLPHVFELFVQADRSLARSRGGLGIGLTLVRRLVEMHGGWVTARSAGPNKGSEFEVRLRALPAARPKTTSVGTDDLPHGRAVRVLVVDDNADAADSLAMLLRMQGHEVDVAYDGAAALEAVQRGRPELVLLDIGLPILNGYEVAQRIPEHADTNRPVIVALTGYGQEENRERAKAAGFDLYLVKPVDPLELTKVLAAVANGSDARSLAI